VAAGSHGAEEVYISILGNWVDLFPCLLRGGWHKRRKRRLAEAAKSAHRDRTKGCGPVLAVVEAPTKVISAISACVGRQLLTCPSEWLPASSPWKC